MIDPSTCSPRKAYSGLVDNSMRNMMRLHCYSSHPWLYADDDAQLKTARDSEVSGLIELQRFAPGGVVHSHEEVKSLEESLDQLHLEWMVERIRANHAEDERDELRAYVTGDDLDYVAGLNTSDNVAWMREDGSVMIKRIEPGNMSPDEAIRTALSIYNTAMAAKNA